MPRQDLDQRLNMIQGEVEVLAGIVEKAILRSVDALKRRDLEASRQVIAEDDYIDLKRFEIEDLCVDLIATRVDAGRRSGATVPAPGASSLSAFGDCRAAGDGCRVTGWTGA